MSLTEKQKTKKREHNKKYYYGNKERIIRNNLERNRRNAIQYRQKMRDYCNTNVGRASRMFNGAKRRAKEKGLVFEITLNDVKKALKTNICERTGLQFEIMEGSSLYAPSIDRKNSELGYTLENVQYVCCAYNMGKKQMDDFDFENFIIQAASNILIKRNS